MKRNQPNPPSPVSVPLSVESFDQWRARVAREQAAQAQRERFASAIERGALLRGHAGAIVGTITRTLREGQALHVGKFTTR